VAEIRVDGICVIPFSKDMWLDSARPVGADMRQPLFWYRGEYEVLGDRPPWSLIDKWRARESPRFGRRPDDR
jgi:hypothetical protein